MFRDKWFIDIFFTEKSEKMLWEPHLLITFLSFFLYLCLRSVKKLSQKAWSKMLFSRSGIPRGNIRCFMLVTMIGGLFLSINRAVMEQSIRSMLQTSLSFSTISFLFRLWETTQFWYVNLGAMIWSKVVICSLQNLLQTRNGSVGL